MEIAEITRQWGIFAVMIARRKKPTGAVSSRIKKMYDEAASKGDKQYQSDKSTAQKAESAASRPQKIKQEAPSSQKDRQDTYSENHRRAGVNATPSKDVEARKGSGMYQGSVPVAGTSSKKMMAKRNPVRGIRRSDASSSVKKSMIRKMKSVY